MRNSNFSNITSIKVPRRIHALLKTKNEKMFFILSLVYVVGIVLGALLIAFKGGVMIEYIMYATKAELLKKATEGVLYSLINSLLSRTILLFILFVLSSCIFGTPLVLFALLCGGVGFGLVCGTAYVSFGLGGLPYILFSLAIPTVIFSFGLFSLATAAIVSSMELYKIAFNGSGRSYGVINEALIKTLFKSFVFAAISSIIEALFILVFKGVIRL